LKRHAFGVPNAWSVERDYPARTGLYAASVWSEIDGHVVHVTGYEPTDEQPKLSGQNIGLAIHRANDVACL